MKWGDCHKIYVKVLWVQSILRVLGNCYHVETVLVCASDSRYYKQQVWELGETVKFSIIIRVKGWDHTTCEVMRGWGMHTNGASWQLYWFTISDVVQNVGVKAATDNWFYTVL